MKLRSARASGPRKTTMLDARASSHGGNTSLLNFSLRRACKMSPTAKPLSLSAPAHDSEQTDLERTVLSLRNAQVFAVHLAREFSFETCDSHLVSCRVGNRKALSSVPVRQNM